MDASAGAGGNNAHDSGMMSQSCSGSCDDNIDCTIDECVSGECSHRVDSSSCGADKVCDPAKGCVTMAGTQEICDGMDNDGDNKIDEDPAASDSCGGGQCTNGACSGCTSNSDRDGLEQLYPYAIGPNTQNSVWTVAGWCVNLNSTSVSKQRACLDAVVEDSLSSRCRQCLYHYQECYGPCGCFATTPPAEPCKCIEKYEECSGVPSGMTCN
jgi:hypothetical protein